HEASDQGQSREYGACGVEERLLCFLEIFVVGERQAFDGQLQRGDGAGDSTGLTAYEFQQVRVFLLRHGTAACGEGLGQRDESVGIGGEQDHLFGPVAQVQHEERERLHELQDEIAIAGGVETVGGGSLESQIMCHERAVE